MKKLIECLIGLACVIAVWWALFYGINAGHILSPGPRLYYLSSFNGGLRG